LQIPHFYAAFSALGCRQLHRIALPVVSVWCQMSADSASLIPLPSTSEHEKWRV